MDDLKIEISRCEYDLQDPHDGFDDRAFDLIRDSVLEWGRERDTACYIEKKPHGFMVVYYSSEIDSETNGNSLRHHLAESILQELKKSGIEFFHRA